jgi:hypothetical protein
MALDQAAYAGIQFRDGVGWVGNHGCGVDKDSNVRQGKKKLTNLKCIHQLFERPFLTTPNLKKGKFYPSKETKLLHQIDTRLKKSCERTSGLDVINYRFTPMIPILKNNVQDPNNIIEENNKWTRAGIPSRQLIRNKNYLKRCGFVNKGKYWKRKTN